MIIYTIIYTYTYIYILVLHKYISTICVCVCHYGIIDSAYNSRIQLSNLMDFGQSTSVASYPWGIFNGSGFRVGPDPKYRLWAFVKMLWPKNRMVIQFKTGTKVAKVGGPQFLSFDQKLLLPSSFFHFLSKKLWRRCVDKPKVCGFKPVDKLTSWLVWWLLFAFFALYICHLSIKMLLDLLRRTQEPHLCQASESFRELVPIMVVVNLQCRLAQRSQAKNIWVPKH